MSSGFLPISNILIFFCLFIHVCIEKHSDTGVLGSADPLEVT